MSVTRILRAGEGYERWKCVGCGATEKIERHSSPAGWVIVGLHDGGMDDLFCDVDAVTACPRCAARVRKVLKLKAPTPRHLRFFK